MVVWPERILESLLNNIERSSILQTMISPINVLRVWKMFREKDGPESFNRLNWLGSLGPSWSLNNKHFFYKGVVNKYLFTSTTYRVEKHVLVVEGTVTNHQRVSVDKMKQKRKLWYSYFFQTDHFKWLHCMIVC